MTRMVLGWEKTEEYSKKNPIDFVEANADFFTEQGMPIQFTAGIVGGMHLVFFHDCFQNISKETGGKPPLQRMNYCISDKMHGKSWDHTWNQMKR